MTSTPTRRPSRNFGFEPTRARILAEARAIMREEGAGALTLHGLARRVGMKTPSLYTYFESKDALFDALFREGMQTYRARQDALEEREGARLESIEAVVRDYLDFANEAPELYAMCFERPVPGFVPSEKSMGEAYGLLEDSNRRVQALMDQGVIRDDLSVEQVRDIILVVMQGLTSLRHANEPGAAPGEGRFGPLVPHLVSMLLATLRPGAHEKQAGESS
jgi:AcrR family transcriptional regulator